MALQILGQGGLFRQMVHALKDKGGVAGLKQTRVETATGTALRYARRLAEEDKNKADAGAAALDRYDLSWRCVYVYVYVCVVYVGVLCLLVCCVLCVVCCACLCSCVGTA